LAIIVSIGISLLKIIAGVTGMWECHSFKKTFDFIFLASLVSKTWLGFVYDNYIAKQNENSFPEYQTRCWFHNCFCLFLKLSWPTNS